MKKLITLVFGLLFFVCSALVVYSQNSPDGRSPNEVSIVKSDRESVVLMLSTGDFRIGEQVLSGQRYDVIEAAGYTSNSDVGSPQVPAKGVLVGIPLDAQIEIEVLGARFEVLPGEYSLPPVPRPAGDRGEPDGWLPDAASAELTVDDSNVSYVKDLTAYSLDSFRPTPVAEVVETGFIRDQRFVRLVLYPFQYNPVTKQVQYSAEMTVAVNFSYPEGKGGEQVEQTSYRPDPYFDQVQRSLVLNYESAREWRGRQSVALVQSYEPLPDGPLFKVMVDADGIYRLSRAELEAAGIPVSGIDPDTFQLVNQGHEVPLRVFESAGVLDSLLFYGQKMDSKYTDTNVYWLTYGQGAGLRMVPHSAPPSATVPVSTSYSTTVHLEENVHYVANVPWAEGDHWWWGWTYYGVPSYPQEFESTVVLSDVVTSPYSATLRAAMHSRFDRDEDPDHCVRLLVNGNFVEQYTWNGEIPMNIVEAFPSSFLQEGVNTVTAQGCATSAARDLIYYNWFEIDYRDSYVAENDTSTFTVEQPGWQYAVEGFSTGEIGIYDVTDPQAVVFLTDSTVDWSAGSQYEARFYDPAAGVGTKTLVLADGQIKSPVSITAYSSSDLANPAHQADYLLITPARFEAAVAPLASLRAADGLSTMVVDVQDVYDEFNWGIFSPEAIRSFLEYAYFHWSQPAPSYVVLVGDGNYDYKDYRGFHSPNDIPPYLAFVDEYVGEMPIDNWYVSVNGGDRIPDMYLGRLAVTTLEQLNATISKILDYEQTPPPGDWNEKGLFVADKNDPDAGNFPILSGELVGNHYPIPPYTATEVYVGVTCPDEYPALTCRQEVIDFFNEGGLFAHYVGHAGPKNWTDRQLFDVNAIASLTPNDKQPITFDAACSTGYFVDPDPAGSCLSESLVRADGKGAIASFSMTGFGTADSEHILSQGFMDAIFFDGVRDLGQATLQSRLRLEESGEEPHLLDTYTLFGDPALHIHALDPALHIEKTVEPGGQLVPGDVLTYTLAFSNTGPGTAFHVVVSDVLPALLTNPSVVYTSLEVVGQRAGATFAWDIADLASGDSGQVIVRATLSPEAGSGLLVNEAEIASAGFRDEASVTTGFGVPDLLVTKTGPRRVMPGQIVTYTLVYSNVGYAIASNTYLTDSLPAGVTYLSDDSSLSHTQPTAGTYVWQVGDLAPGQGATFHLSAQVSAQAQLDQVVTNTLTIGSDSLDPVQENDRSQWATTISLAGTRSYLPVVIKNVP